MRGEVGEQRDEQRHGRVLSSGGILRQTGIPKATQDH